MHTDPLHQLLYISKATRSLDEASLRALLDAARAHNAARGVTGALLCYDGHFLQVLEGSRSEVLALYERIRTDPRHHDVVLVSSEPAQTRQFASWSMRCLSPPRGDRAVMAFFDATRRAPSAAHLRTAVALLEHVARVSAS